MLCGGAFEWQNLRVIQAGRSRLAGRGSFVQLCSKSTSKAATTAPAAAGALAALLLMLPQAGRMHRRCVAKRLKEHSVPACAVCLRVRSLARASLGRSSNFSKAGVHRRLDTIHCAAQLAAASVRHSASQLAAPDTGRLCCTARKRANRYCSWLPCGPKLSRHPVQRPALAACKPHTSRLFQNTHLFCYHQLYRFHSINQQQQFKQTRIETSLILSLSLPLANTSNHGSKLGHLGRQPELLCGSGPRRWHRDPTQ